MDYVRDCILSSSDRGGSGWLYLAGRTATATPLNTETIRAAEGQFYVPFTVTNSGGKTAESVQIAAELRVGGAISEAATVEINFLSNDEKAEGAFIFSRDPRQGKLTLRVASYKLP